MKQAQDWSRTRLAMAGVGGVGGLSLWALVELLPDLIDNARLLLVLFIVVIGFFVVLMSLAGPNPVRRSVLPALGLSSVVAMLSLLASFRFAALEPFVDAVHPAAAVFIIYLVATPFISVRLEHGRAHQLDYDKLFQTAWGMIVRALAAVLFTWLFWGVVFLSDVLLGLVGLDIIEEILEIEAMPFVISGTVLGLAIAVAHEWRAYVSPHLVLRLFRLLVPVVVPVLALFLVALVLSGLDDAWKFFSETALLTGVAIGGITLVTVSVDRDAGHQVSLRWMVWMVRALAVLLLPVALLALWGISVRVLQYGWTPPRVLAALCVVNVLIYGLVYAALALSRGAWMERLRRANVALALWSLALAALWLTPVMDAEKLSADAQLERILDGRATPDQAAIWELTHEWGRAGEQALDTLRTTADYPARTQILALIERAEQSGSQWDFQDEIKQQKVPEQAQELLAMVPVYPEGQSLPKRAFEGLHSYQMGRVRKGCETLTDDGAPGCLFLIVPFHPESGLTEGLLIYKTDRDTLEVRGYWLEDGVLVGGVRPGTLIPGTREDIAETALRDIREGKYEITPAQVGSGPIN